MEAALISQQLQAVAALKANTLEIDRLRKFRKRHRFDCFTPLQRRTALVLYDMCHYETEVPVLYCQNVLSARNDDSVSWTAAALATLVGDSFVVCNDEEVNSLSLPT